MNTKPVRLVDVAAKAEVSVTTVSLALRNHPRISEVVRSQVKQIATEMGYRPDPVAQALRDKSSEKNGVLRFFGTVGLVMSKSCAETRSQTSCCKEWDEMLRQCCRNSGYNLDRFEVGPSEREQKSLDRILKARGIRGLLFYGANEELHEWKLDWNHYAAVAYCSSRHEHFVHDVISSSYHDTYDVMKHLHKLGYKRPGYFIPESRYDYWSVGFTSARNKLYETSDVPVADRSLQEKTQTAFCNWVKQHQPDVVIACEVQRLDDLKALGLRVPEDIGFIWLDILPGREEISGMVQQRDSAHKMMIDTLHGMLTRNEYGPPKMPMCIQVPSFWNKGTTVCKQG
jgi:LacI family transcriptional regulator